MHTLNHPARIHDVKFVARSTGDGEVLLVAAEDKKTVAYEISADVKNEPKLLAAFVGHANRCVSVNLAMRYKCLTLNLLQ